MYFTDSYTYTFNLNQINRTYLPRQNNETIRHLHSRLDLIKIKIPFSNYHVAAAFHIQAVQQIFYGVILIYMHVNMVFRTKEAE